ncbi:MAG: WG repeat-containing protein, partial [Leptospiraceae bacterium]|nr:WG repeat-containing protein [Leptospiraceae bacterium]
MKSYLLFLIPVLLQCQLLPENLLSISDEQSWGDENGITLERTVVGYKFGYIDTSGKLVIPAKFDEVFPFKNGVARVRIGSGYGFIDVQGNYIQKPVCGEYDSQYENFYQCTEDGISYVRNWKGKNIVDEPLTWIREADEGLVALRKGSQRATYFSLNGKILFEADEIGYWSDGRAPFREGGGWGYIKEDGSILIPAKYDRADRFSNGYGYVSSGCRNYTVSTSGELSLANPRPRASVMECGPKSNLQYCEGRIDDPMSVACEKAIVEDKPAMKCKLSDGAFTVKGADWVSAFQKGLGF